MEKIKTNITEKGLSLIISLIAIITFAGAYMTKQTELEVKLANINETLEEIRIKLDKRDDEIKDLTERVIKLEQGVK